MGFLYSGTGEFAPAQRDRDLPPKVPGEHRWIATTAFILTDDDVRTEMRAQDGSGERQYLDNRNLFFIGIGCYDCELPLGEIEPGSHCPDPGDAR